MRISDWSSDVCSSDAIRRMLAFYGHTEFLRQRAGFSSIVNMAVGNENFLDLHAMLGCCSLQPTEIAARIDECALARGRAPQQCAVLLQWRYGDDSGFERRCGHERTNGEPGRLVQVLCLYPTRLPVQITRPITLTSAGSMSSQTG